MEVVAANAAPPGCGCGLRHEQPVHGCSPRTIAREGRKPVPVAPVPARRVGVRLEGVDGRHTIAVTAGGPVQVVVARHALALRDGPASRVRDRGPRGAALPEGTEPRGHQHLGWLERRVLGLVDDGVAVL
ncbi:hypothetical protein ACFPRL_27235 [Pseudoclavibacter helvolus]